MCAQRDAELAERLAARTLELVDVPSESRDEARAGGARRRRPADGGVAVATPATPACSPRRDAPVAARRAPRHRPRPGQPPGPPRRRARARPRRERHEGRAGGDDRARAGRRAASAACSSAARSCRPRESALTPLLEREPRSRDELVVVMEPTDNALHAGCLGQHQRHVDVPRAHAGTPRGPGRRQRDPRAPRAAIAALAALSRVEHEFDGLTFVEVGVGHADRAAGSPQNVIPDRAECARELPLRPRRTPAEAPRRGCASCADGGDLGSTRNAPSGAGADRATRSRSA